MSNKNQPLHAGRNVTNCTCEMKTLNQHNYINGKAICKSKETRSWSAILWSETSSRDDGWIVRGSVAVVMMKSHSSQISRHWQQHKYNKNKNASRTN